MPAMGSYQPAAETTQIIETLKRSAAALRDADVPFALAGSVACWARGGPAPYNDVDFAVREQDGERGLQALADAGMRPERPPEGWLLKAWDRDVLVDLIWDFSGLPGVDELLERADELSVQAQPLPVMALDDVMVSKLCAMDEHALDFAGPLAAARALREQIDWRAVRARTAHWPYAHGFFAMLEALEILAPAESGGSATEPVRGAAPRVRVVGDG
jgi:Uncharacterised nucleotidyltransferase